MLGNGRSKDDIIRALYVEAIAADMGRNVQVKR